MIMSPATSTFTYMHDDAGNVYPDILIVIRASLVPEAMTTLLYSTGQSAFDQG